MKPIRDLRVRANLLRGEARVCGVRLPIENTVISLGLQRLLAEGKFELSEARAAKKLIADGETVLELGSCTGFISSYVRRHTRAGRIICVEANPQLIPYIERVHRLNGVGDAVVLNVVVQPAPLQATVPFYCRAEVPTSSLSANGTTPVISIVDVATMRLADVLNTYQPRTLIMDIEGGELEILNASTIEPVEKLVMEIHPRIYGKSGTREAFANVARL
ncbi:MAG: FkbM family methyltransferase, partial [Hyphomicrobiaceae bacterium]